jgi:CheY-like chemotaxis protein
LHPDLRSDAQLKDVRNLRQFRVDIRSPQLLLTGVAMPGMTGAVLARKLLPQSPRIGIL